MIHKAMGVAAGQNDKKMNKVSVGGGARGYEDSSNMMPARLASVGNTSSNVYSNHGHSLAYQGSSILQSAGPMS
jgi:hypothetical protein